jgi:hypothetical protein
VFDPKILKWGKNYGKYRYSVFCKRV